MSQCQPNFNWGGHRLVNADTLVHPASYSKLRKQAIATVGAAQPTTVSEWLHWITFERIDEILGATVPMAFILTDARPG